MSLSEASTKEERTAECPICLNELSSSCVLFPTLCPTPRCAYNICTTCLSALLDSSKDGYEEASDGNMSVKVRLSCPQCRGGYLCVDETLRLRRVADIHDLMDISDEQLSAADLRRKHSLDSTNSHQQTSEALKRYNQHRSSASSRDEQDQQDFDSYDDAASSQEEAVLSNIDTTLFGGLEYAMTEAEQQYVTSLMTSGSAFQLAQAAQILNSIAEMSLKGLTPSMRTTSGAVPSPTATHTSRQSSRNKMRSGYSNAGVSRSKATPTREQVAANKAKEWKRLHPLPVRMPLYCSLDLFDPYQKNCMIQFLDDDQAEDTDLTHVFCRLAIDRKNQVVTRGVDAKAIDPEGMKRVLHAEDGASDWNKNLVNNHIMPKRRVVISSVKGAAAKMGLRTGDVITHLNGDPLEGSAEKLRFTIASMNAGKSGFLKLSNSQENEEKFSMVVNAESATAEVLRLRSFC